MYYLIIYTKSFYSGYVPVLTTHRVTRVVDTNVLAAVTWPPLMLESHASGGGASACRFASRFGMRLSDGASL